MAGSAQCSVKSLRCIQAMCVRGTASVRQEQRPPMQMLTHSIYSIFLPTTLYAWKCLTGHLAAEGNRLWVVRCGGALAQFAGMAL